MFSVFWFPKWLAVGFGAHPCPSLGANFPCEPCKCGSDWSKTCFCAKQHAMSRNSSPDSDGYIKLLARSRSCLCKPRQLVNNDGNDNSNNNYKCMFIEHILTERQPASLVTNIKLLLSSWTVFPLVSFLPLLGALGWIPSVCCSFRRCQTISLSQVTGSPCSYTGVFPAYRGSWV